MSSSAEPVTVTPLSAVGSGPLRGTVVSPLFDLSFFVLPPLGTWALLLAQRAFPTWSFAMAATIWVVLAQSHFGATFLFYLDRSSVDVYRRSPWIYFVIPSFLIALSAASGLTALAPLAALLVPLGSFWHGNRQSIGVAGLYRGLSRAFDRRSRWLEQLTIFSGSACFTAAGIVHLGLLDPFVETSGWTNTPLAVRLFRAALALSLVLLATSLWRAYRQSRSAGVRPWLRLAVLTSSWGMYAPYVVAGDPLSAFLASLIPHYMQYHGLVFRVNHNKIEEGLRPVRTALLRIARTPLAYASSTTGFGLALGALVTLAWTAGRIEVGLGLVYGINLAHFWLDSFFWRFRDPAARDATLRFISPRRTPVATATRA